MQLSDVYAFLSALSNYGECLTYRDTKVPLQAIHNTSLSESIRKVDSCHIFGTLWPEYKCDIFLIMYFVDTRRFACLVG